MAATRFDLSTKMGDEVRSEKCEGLSEYNAPGHGQRAEGRSLLSSVAETVLVSPVIW